MAKKAHLPNSIKLYGLDTVSTLVLYCDENSVCKSSRYWNASLLEKLLSHNIK
jgi:hypothetical protein